MKRFFLLVLFIFMIHPVSASDEIEIPLIAEYGRGTINAMAWNPTGDVLAVSSGNGIWFYDAEFNTLGHWGEDNYTALAWNASGNYLAVIQKPLAECRKQVLSSPITNLSLVYEELDEAESCIQSFSWHGDSLAFAANNFIKIMDMNNQELIFSTELASLYLNALSISPDGAKLLAISDSAFWLWDISTTQLLQEKQVDRDIDDFQWLHKAIIWDESHFFILCSQLIETQDEYRVCAWNIDTGEEVHNFQGASFTLDHFNWAIYFSLISPRELLFMLPNFDNDRDEFHWVSPTDNFSFAPLRGKAIHTHALHPSRASISFGTEMGYLINYSLTENRILTEREIHSFSVNDLAWHPSDGRLALSAYGLNRDLQILQLESNEQLVDTGIRLETSVADWVDWSPDGSSLYYGGNHNGATLNISSDTERDSNTYEFIDGWNVQITKLYEFQQIPPAAFSNDRSRYAEYLPESESVRLDRQVDLRLIADIFYWLLWSPDNRFLAAYFRREDSYQLIIWDTSTESIFLTENLGQTVQWQYSPDSHYLSYIDYEDGLQRVRFISVLADTKLEAIVVRDNLSSKLVWSPDSHYLLVASSQMNFYAIPSQELVASIDNRLSALDWRADGHYLAGSRNGRIFVWDTSGLFD